MTKMFKKIPFNKYRKIHIIFMNSENSKTSQMYWLVLHSPDKIISKRSDKYAIL